MEAAHAELVLRIDWSEMDQFGHINNVMFAKYIQAARVQFWESIGMGAGPDDNRNGGNLASISCEFKAPLFYPGNVKIITAVSFIKNSSFGLLHKLYNDDLALVAIGNDVVVYYNYSQNQKQELTPELRQVLTHYLIP
jgi:acyl-CoA thioester hydrolase